MDSDKNGVLPIIRFIKNKPLISFFIISYLGSWVISIPFILSEWGIIHGDMRIFFVCKAFAGPFLAAFLINYYINGKKGIKELRKQIRNIQAKPIYYVIALFILPFSIAAISICYNDIGNSFIGVSWIIIPKYIITFIAVFFGGGPLAEEPGWRGFALPRMQERFGPILASLVLGVLWAAWHLPDFLTSAQGGGPGVPLNDVCINLLTFVLMVVCLSLFFSWLANKTTGSLFIVLLAHASINTYQVVIAPLFTGLTDKILNRIVLLVFGIIGILLVIITKGKLGYKKTVAI
jgi:uncharacterized protein